MMSNQEVLNKVDIVENFQNKKIIVGDDNKFQKHISYLE